MSTMSIVNIQKSSKPMAMMARLVRPIAMVEVELATSTTKQMTVTETYSNKSVSNQAWRKLVKHHNSQNVNQYDTINVYRYSRIFSWMSFFVQKTKVHPKFTLLLFETSKGYFSCCLIYFFSSIDISLRYLDVTMSKCFWNGLKRKTCLFSKMLEFMRSLMDIIFLHKYVIM